MNREPEITEPVDLCEPDGSLNPDAVGWTRRPVHRANLSGHWGRTKRWEYWGLVTPTHFAGIVVSSLDYAGVHSIWVCDRRTGRTEEAAATVPLARGTELPVTAGAGTVRTGKASGLQIVIDQSPTSTRLIAESLKVAAELEFPVVADHESMGVVVPWSDRLFQYTVKDVSRPARGRVRLGEDWHVVEDGASFGVLDHGRGRWPYRSAWNWAAGSGADGRGVQLGGRWTDGTGSTENALLLDGRLHKIGEDLRWEYDRSDWLRPWRIRGQQADITFVPECLKRSRTNLGVLAGDTHQCFGTFTGWVQGDDGVRAEVDGLVGWAEEALNRW